MVVKKCSLFSAILFAVFLLTGTSVQAATYNVSRSGGGTYNCDGNADQVEINQALQAAAGSPGSIVHMGPGKYVLSDTITIGDSTTLEGEEGTVLTFAESFWPDGSSNDALIENSGKTSSTGKNTIVLRHFEIDGGYNNNNRGDSDKDIGDGRRNFMNFLYNNLEIYDMYWHNSPGDGVKVRYSTNVKIHNLKMDTLGHDGIVLQSCKNGDIYNNNIRTRGNAGVRLFGSSFIAIHDNFIYAVEGEFFSPGGPGLELQRGVKGDDLHDLEVYNNLLYHTWQAGIQLVAFDSPAYTKDQVKNIHIHHNIIAKCGWHASYDWMAGIVTSGVYNVVIENNTLDGNYGGGVVYLESLGLQSNGTSGKYDVHVRNNIITNSVKRGGNKGGSPGAGDASQSGQGIINYNPAEGQLFLENNLVYGNVGGDYKNVSSASDIHEDPLYANVGTKDYHLKSVAGRWDEASKSWVSDSVSSPAIDTGLASSDYSKEPAGNGGRINIGRYGNTSQSSLSGAVRQNAMPPAPAEDVFTPGVEETPSGGSASGGSAQAWADGRDTPSYYDPGKAVTEPSYFQEGNPAVSPKELEIDAYFPGLGDSAPTATEACSDIADSAGFIPCGRHTNDPATSWNECEACDFCSIPLAIQLVINFLVKFVGIAAVLMIVLGQLLAMTAIGETDMMVKIKAVLGKALMGFAYVMAAWVLVNSILAFIGYTDPLGGQWYTVC